MVLSKKVYDVLLVPDFFLDCTDVEVLFFEFWLVRLFSIEPESVDALFKITIVFFK